MAVFLLWNVRENQATDNLVYGLVRQFNVDVVLLVEYPIATSQLPTLLLPEKLVKRKSADRFGVFVRDTHKFRKLRFRLGTRANLWEWEPPSGQVGVIALLHGLDRLHYDDSTRRMLFRKVAAAVQRWETKCQHRHSIIAGDFNAQPFESAVSAADGLHAIGLRSVKQAPTRKVREGDGAAEFFYNPMWRVYGQQPHSEAGSATHYWTKEWGHELAWHMLDQVVLRPGESSRFPEDQLQIVNQVGGISLLDGDGIPDKKTASDHLPLVFRWDL
jgi:hypothetical protein